MRPLRLTLEGFTSFRDRLELDFSGLDLFAITGATGAGKSSLIDAMVFALYGQVPRVGDDYKQLISHGKERLSVLFEFGVGKQRYRIARAARPDKPSQQRLERLVAGGSEPMADRAREIRSEVDRILGLDYDGFTRSVVLPQGQFDAFLKGEPKERRKILVALLNLSVYERMQQLANQKSAGARSEAEFIRRQLETDFAAATDEALVTRRAELVAAEAEAREAEAGLAALAEAAGLAQKARAARRDMAAAERDATEERKRLDAAWATLAGAGSAREKLQIDLAEASARLAASGVDEARYTALVAAKPRAEQLVGLRQSLARAAQAVAEKRAGLAEARRALASDESALPAVEKAEAEARAQETAARVERDAAHREHLAAGLRRGLKPGDPCPVCAQEVRKVPKAEAPGLATADSRVSQAEAAARAAAQRLEQARVAREQKKAKAEGLARELTQAEAQERDGVGLLEPLSGELARSGFGEAETRDATALVGRIQVELKQLDAARGAHAAIEGQQKAIEQQLARLDAEVAAATAACQVVDERLASLAARRTEAEQALALARAALLAAAARGGFELDPLPAGKDEADVVESLRSERQSAAAARAARVATLGQSVESLEKALARAADLRASRERLEQDAALAKTLAEHLKANELVAWIQEEALARLAEGGTRHLATLSQGRYALRLGSGAGENAARAEQDFFVVDHWNGDSVRSVRTLSGGETFLASLALALSLAESLSELSSEARTQDALESLFLDEGFGTLDAETLDVVVSALDALHGGQRMVGIVTHVRELAERLPARVEVRRVGTTATAVVV